jgi:hypothetical protein
MTTSNSTPIYTCLTDVTSGSFGGRFNNEIFITLLHPDSDAGNTWTPAGGNVRVFIAKGNIPEHNVDETLCEYTDCVESDASMLEAVTERQTPSTDTRDGLRPLRGVLWAVSLAGLFYAIVALILWRIV